MNWQPDATLDALRLRAAIIHKIRQFFYERHVLEVETPLLASSTATDPYIASFQVGAQHYLQTSPEFAMKRLLATGSGAIYQICKAFRHEQSGRFHNPEFTMLEWYRPGFDHHQLMDEVDALLHCILHSDVAERKTYAELFLHHLQIDPHHANAAELRKCALAHNLTDIAGLDKTAWLDVLLTHLIEPNLGKDKPCFIYDFPVEQAALAKIADGVAQRFEVYVNGIELANGYHELTSANEQQMRFLKDNQLRDTLNFPQIPLDYRLIAGLEHGMPDCAGVALGIDRLIMLAANAQSIADIISFTFANA